MLFWVFFIILFPHLSVPSLLVFHHFLPLLRFLNVSHFLVKHVQSEWTVWWQYHRIFDWLTRQNVVHSSHFYPIQIKIAHPVPCDFCKLFDFLIVFNPIEVFPLSLAESFGENVWYSKNTADDLTGFEFFGWLINVFFVFSIWKLTQYLIFLLKNIDFSRIFVGPLSKKKPSDLKVLSISSIFGIGLKEPHINWINIPSNSRIQSHFNKRIVITITFILLSLEIKGADWRMMRNLFKR